MVIDRRTKTHGRTAPVAVGVVCTILVTILAVASPLQATLALFIPVIILHMLVGSTGYPIMTTVTSMTTPSRNLGKVIAVMYAVSNLVAAVFGPMLVALVSDHMFHGPRALASALAWVTGGYGLVSTLSLLVLLRTLKAANVDDR
jgi:MFS family permease